MATLFDAYNKEHPDYKTAIEIRRVNRKGTFDVTGYTHLERNSQKLYKKMKPSEPVEIYAVIDNKYDKTAVAVFYKEKHIGWLNNERANKYKPVIFEGLKEDRQIEAQIAYIEKRGQYYDLSIEIIFPM